MAGHSHWANIARKKSLIDAKRLHIPGEGGWLGKWIGSGLFATLLGKVGAALLLCSLYLAALLLMTGVHPANAALFEDGCQYRSDASPLQSQERGL